MTAVDYAIPRLKIEEGFRAFPYSDSAGKTTVGYGCNLAAGLSIHAGSALLQAQAEERHEELLEHAWYAALDPVRQSACLDISFNVGVQGLMGFSKMIAALNAQQWQTAATECKVKNPELAGRYRNLANILLTGVA